MPKSSISIGLPSSSVVDTGSLPTGWSAYPNDWSTYTGDWDLYT
jgi:hypothetical protein